MTQNNNIYQPPKATLLDSEEIPAPELPLASLGQRFLGAIIEELPATAVFYWLFYHTDWWGYIPFNDTGYPELLSDLAAFCLWLGIWLIFNYHLMKTRGQSIGKLAMGIKIVTVDDNKLPEISNSIGKRYILLLALGYIPVIGPFLHTIDVLFIFRQDRRCVHDLIAKTKVVRCKP